MPKGSVRFPAPAVASAPMIPTFMALLSSIKEDMNIRLKLAATAASTTRGKNSSTSWYREPVASLSMAL
jgi:hypothetical protein